eukprot:maker-scaffold505_size153196-snap-gene-0.22 protein:Tk05999 transcript:maker-scaffold505_size153196-snap-gene-0.22-mRNA-1 annotation:"4.1 G protein "
MDGSFDPPVLSILGQLGNYKNYQISPVKTFHVKILLLDKQELIQEVTGKTTGQDLLDVIFKHLNLLETAYFGLRFQDCTNQTHWLDPSKRVSDQLQVISPITLYLGVKFYAADPCRLVEEITRYQFFLQVKLDVLQGRLPVSQELAIELCAYALQSELGDYDSSRHSPGYVSEFRFVSSQTEEMEDDIEQTHRKLQGMLPSEAEMAYLEKVKWLDMYGVDLHPVVGEDNIEYYLGLTPSGIIVLRNRGKVGNYFWPRISKIYFKARFFMLRVRDKHNDESTYGFETPSRQACKHLWKCCVEHHAFFRLVQVSPSFGGTGVFSLGSRFRFSGSTEKQALSEVQSIRRPQPQFSRRPSTRYSRRNGQPSMPRDQPDGQADDHPTNSYEESLATNGRLNGSLPRNGTTQRFGNSSTAHRSTSSLPRNISLRNRSIGGPVAHGADLASPSGGPEESLQDLSLQSLQWLESRGLYGTNRSRGGRRGSTAETGSQSLVNTYVSQPNHHRQAPRKSTANASDNESEASGVSWTSGLHPHQRRNRHESGSESEKSSRRAHRSRRKRQGSYKLVESDEQWQAVQQQRSSASHRGRSSSRASGIGIQEAGLRKSGYMNSGAETESEMTTTHVSSSMRRTRRRQRSRSRSPASEARHRLPAEVLQHVEFGLVEPNSESVKGEIPYTNVETARPVKLRGFGGPQQPGPVRGPSGDRRSRHNSGGSLASHLAKTTIRHVPGSSSKSEVGFRVSGPPKPLQLTTLPNVGLQAENQRDNSHLPAYPPLGLPTSQGQPHNRSASANLTPSFHSLAEGPLGASGLISASSYFGSSAGASPLPGVSSNSPASHLHDHHPGPLPHQNYPQPAVGLPFNGLAYSNASIAPQYSQHGSHNLSASVSGFPPPHSHSMAMNPGGAASGWYDSISTGSNSFVMTTQSLTNHQNYRQPPPPPGGSTSGTYSNLMSTSTPLAGIVDVSVLQSGGKYNNSANLSQASPYTPSQNKNHPSSHANSKSSPWGLKPRRVQASTDEMSTEL